MRIAIDMQGALTVGSRPRGIGRYTTQLVNALVDLRGDRDLRLLLNSNHTAAAQEVAEEYGKRLPKGAVSHYRVPRTESYDQPPSAPKRKLGDAIVRRHVAGLAPDVLLATSLFELGPGDFSPPDLSSYPARLTCAVVYDLIPLVFPDLYLSSPLTSGTYRATAASLNKVDLLLAISESARQDAIRLLGVDPDRIVNISGATDDRFRPLQITDARRNALQQQAGVTRPFIMYVSGADQRKNLKGAVTLFASLPAESRRSYQLLLVTMLSAEDIAEFKAYAASLGVEPDGLVIVGGINDDLLVELLNTCALFIFPSLYEGFGLPILEAMQCGAPVLAADNSSIPEIVDREDLRFDPGNIEAAAAKLERLLRDEALRRDVSAWGVERAKRFTWQNSARRALDAMDEHLARRNAPHVLPCQMLDLDAARAELAETLAAEPEMDDQIGDIVDDLLFSVPQFQEAASRRLLIDTTITQQIDAWTGIQRVVRQVTAAFYEKPPSPDIIPVAVRLEPAAIHSVPDFTGATLGRLPVGRPYPIELRAGDDLFMLDSNWEAYVQFEPLFQDVERKGGRIITCIYDLIPELYPQVCSEGMPAAHTRWLETAIWRSHGLICISRAVADELITYIQSRRLPHRPGLHIGWFHCGSDILRGSANRAPQEPVLRAFNRQHPVFVSVGTIEPRKDQALALKAFELLWSRGVDASLCLIGKHGWKVEEFTDRLRSHKEFGKRLHWFFDAKDVDVVHAYHHAEAVLCTSMAEGFGLPLAEAARMGKPVICSDIPVFREVGGQGAVYFPVGDAAALASTLEDWIAGKLKADPALVSRSSWADAAERIGQVLYHGDWYQILD
ncbi:glycosyltransferase family 4 protein [Pseudoroseomonas ludipueritiae]